MTPTGSTARLAFATETRTPDRTEVDWTEVVGQLGRRFAERTAEHDRTGSFVEQNYEELRAARVLSAAIPTEHGGGGASYTEVCELLRQLAKHCPSTALSLSMHMHLVAASVFKYRQGAEGEAALQTRIAQEQISLVSTGASDWIDSNGSLERVEGGFRFTGRKVFASGCPTAAVMVTSGRYDDPREGSQVLHFPISFGAEGVEIQDDWNALGMRGTGSHSVVLTDVFVPEEKIGLRRPSGEWHPVWSIVLTVAMPLIMSVYRGIAEKAHSIAIDKVRLRAAPSYLAALVGELENRLAATQIAIDSMIALTNDYDFEPALATANAMLVRKTLATEAAEATVRKAAEVAGGSSFFRAPGRLGLEQLLRDVQAVSFHPLPKPRQLEFSGRLALGESPLGGTSN